MTESIDSDLRDLLPIIKSMAERAALIVQRHYQSSDRQITEKSDRTPVTAADLAAHRLIVDELGSLTPRRVIISEEDAESTSPIAQIGEQDFWLVDPLDGTKEFIQRNGEFTVNIALIRSGQPVLGVVVHPPTMRIYSGIPGQGAWLQISSKGPEVPLQVRRYDAQSPVALLSRSHRSTEELVLQKYLPGVSFVHRGSSLKFCELAAGQADVYFRMSPTKEWDTAAGHAVLAAAGGKLVDLQSNALIYGKADLLNAGFIATGEISEDKFLELLKILTSEI